jgi:hypothetical protein
MLIIPSLIGAVYVHIDAESAMSGVSRFGEWNRPHWKYSKNESHRRAEDYHQYSHLLTADPVKHGQDGWFTVLEVVYGFDRIKPPSWLSMVEPADSGDQLGQVAADFWVAKLILKPKLFVMQRNTTKQQ